MSVTRAQGAPFAPAVGISGTGGDWIPVPVPEYRDCYELNLDTAEVRSLDRVIVTRDGVRRQLRGRILVQTLNNRDAFVVTLSRSGKRRVFSVETLHRCTLEASREPRP